jgi:hypothetical protein
MRTPCLISVFVIFSGIALAQDVAFEATVDKNPVAMGDQFTLSFVLSNAGMGGGKNFQLPDLSRFHIMAGPSQSTSMQIINGAVSSSVTYTYVLQPKEIGKFTIGSATVEAGGKQYRSNPFTIEVVQASSRPKQQAKAPDDLSVQIGDNLFLKASVDRTHVMQGEQINLTYKLYMRVSVTNYAVDKNPTFTGFWGEDIENPKNISLTNETIDGKQYRVGVIRKMALFPTQSGTLEISPMHVQTTVQVQTRSLDPFDSFFRDPFGRSVNYMVKSDAVKIKVDPLPPGAPAGFKGAVGRFTMNTVVDKRTTKTNEPVTLKVTVSGTGNIKLLETPAITLPSDFEQYSPKVSDNINKQSEKISGSKVFEYLFIPRYPGTKTIKPITFTYFDLSKRDYVTLSSSPVDLTIEQGAASPGPLVVGGERSDIRLLSEDIRFIKVGSVSLARRGDVAYKSGWFVAVVVVPLFGLAGAFVYARRRESVMRDEAGYRNRCAIKVAQKGLKHAERLLHGGTNGGGKAQLAFYSEVSRALWKYLSDKLNIQQADFSIEGAVHELQQRSVDGQVASSLKTLLETCDMARFAPTGMDDAAMRKTFDNARQLIIELERTLKT